jgi:hypothetical protein
MKPKILIDGKPVTPEEAMRQFHEMHAKCGSLSDPFDDPEDDREDDPNACPRCGGAGKVTTEDYESYLGAMYKPCPECGGDPCTGEPPRT